MDDDDYTPMCGKVCPCTPTPPAWYAGECTLPAGHMETDDFGVPRLHSASGYCYYDDEGNKVEKPS